MRNKIKEALPNFYFSFIVVWLRIMGIEVLKEKESLLSRLLFRFHFTFGLVYVIIEIIELKFHSNFKNLSLVIWYAVIHGTTIVKVIVVYRNRKEIGNIMKLFHSGYYKPITTQEDKYEEDCIRKILNQVKHHATRYSIFLLMCCIPDLITSLIIRFTKPPEYWVLPYITMSLVLAGYVFCGWIYLCDCTVMSVIGQIVAQLQILGRRIRNFHAAGTLYDKHSGLVINALHDCIKHHHSLLETVNKLENLYSYLILFAFLADGFLLCFVMYLASVTPSKSIEFGRYLVYTGSTIIQLFIYCWWGNEMTLANEKFAKGIFESYRSEDPISCAKALKLMLLKAQKPLFLTVGKFVPLSLITYTRLIKASFSYFTVLRQVNSKETL